MFLNLDDIFFLAFLLLIWPIMIGLVWQFFRVRKVSTSLITVVISVIVNFSILILIVSQQNTKLYRALEGIHSNADDYLVSFICIVAPLVITLSFKVKRVLDGTYNKAKQSDA